jgi:Gamma interferon inducible lysosomal thiol reductase (GILT)
MHGPEECAGNVHELCVAKYTASSSVWWPFLLCLNHQGRNRIGTETGAKHCAELTNIDWVGSGIEACVKGSEGPRLLRESAAYTEELGVK